MVVTHAWLSSGWLPVKDSRVLSINTPALAVRGKCGPMLPCGRFARQQIGHTEVVTKM
jgi:hypothetical protein